MIADRSPSTLTLEEWPDWNSVIPFRLDPTKAATLILLTGWLAYANCFTKPFLLDDNAWILGNDQLSSWSGNLSSQLQRFFVAFSLTLNWKIGGFYVSGYHLLNLIFHISSALLLFDLVRRTLLLPRWHGRFESAATTIALTTSLIWVSHPLNTHAVTYVIQRCESFMGFFYVGALYCLVCGSTGSSAWYLLAVLSAWIGAGCKEVIVTIVPVALAYDRVFLGGPWLEMIRRRGLVHLGFLATFLWPVFIHYRVFYDPISNDVGPQIPGQGPWQYLLTECGVLIHYLQLAIMPVNLSFEYRDWPIANSLSDVLPQAIVLTTAFLASMIGLWFRNGFAFLSSCFFFVLSLTSSVFPILDVANEYRMYVPLMAISTAAVIGVYLLLPRFVPEAWDQPWLVVAGVGVVVGSLVVLTSLRNEDYRTQRSIWEDVLDKRPQNWKVYNHIGSAYEIEGDWKKAKEFHLKCLEKLPGSFTSMSCAGILIYREGEAKRGLKMLFDAYRIFPADPQTTLFLAIFLHLEGDNETALRLVDHARKIGPHKAHPVYFRGAVLDALGRKDEAKKQYESAARLHPDWLEKLHHYARLRLRQSYGDAMTVRKEALYFAKLAVDASPEPTAEMYETLADAYAWIGQPKNAIEALQRAIHLSETPERAAKLRQLSTQ